MGGPLKLKFANNFIIYQKSPLSGRLGLAGYTQSSGTGELNPQNFKNHEIRQISVCMITSEYYKTDELSLIWTWTSKNELYTNYDMAYQNALLELQVPS